MRRRKFLTTSGTALALLAGCLMPDDEARVSQLKIENVESDVDVSDVVVEVVVSNSGKKRGSARLVVQLDVISTNEKERDISISAGESEKFRFRFDLTGWELYFGILRRVDARIEN